MSKQKCKFEKNFLWGQSNIAVGTDRPFLHVVNLDPIFGTSYGPGVICKQRARPLGVALKQTFFSLGDATFFPL